MAEKKSVTQKDVAERAGVSRGVVSYVINNGPRSVSPETRKRVLSAIQELGYRPNKHAQRLKMGSDAARNSIGIVTGGRSYNILNRPYFNKILSGLFDSAHEYEQFIRFFVFWDALKDPVFFNKNIHPDEISSLIIILPSLIVGDPENEKLLLEIADRIPNVICLEDSVLDLLLLARSASWWRPNGGSAAGRRAFGSAWAQAYRLSGDRRTAGIGV